jgi:F-type H+-transporting ATPase subunit epsilon
MRVDIVTPERKLASADVVSVQIPGADGDMTAMEGHAPTITTLRPGVLRANAANGSTAYVVTGGFAEITAAGVSVLAEQAVPLEEASGAMFDKLIAEAREAAAATEDKDMAEKLVADMMAARTAAGQ